MSLYFEEIVEEDDIEEEYFDESFQELDHASRGGGNSESQKQSNLAKFEQLLGKAHGNDDSYNEFDESFIEYEEEIIDDIVSPTLTQKARIDDSKSSRIPEAKKADAPKSPKTPRKSSRRSENESSISKNALQSPKSPKTPRKSSRQSMKESLSELAKKSSKSPKTKSPKPKRIKQVDGTLGSAMSTLEMGSQKTPKSRKSSRKSRLKEDLPKSLSGIDLDSPKTPLSRKSLKKEGSEKNLGKKSKRTPRSKRTTLAAGDMEGSLSSLKSPDSAKKKIPGDKSLRRQTSDSNLKGNKAERRRKSVKAPHSSETRRKKLYEDDEKLEMLLGISNSNLGKEKEEENKRKDKSSLQKNLARFETLLGNTNSDEVDAIDENTSEKSGGKARTQSNLEKFEKLLGKAHGSEDDFEEDEIIEDEIIEDEDEVEVHVRKQSNLAKFEQLIGNTGDENSEETMIVEEVNERKSATSKDRENAHASFSKNSLIFEQLLLKAHGTGDEFEEYEYEEIEEDSATTNRDSMAFRTVSRSRRALLAKGNEEYNAMQQSFRTQHKSRRAAMMDLKTSVRQIIATVEKDNTTDNQNDDDEEWEEQIIEKWFRRDSLPDDLSAACKELIPIVYKGDDVNADTMMRRTPLKELYKYLKQHLDYKQMKATQNLNRFEQLFESSNDVSYGNLSPHEESVEIDGDILNLSSHALDKKSRRSERKGQSKQTNEDVFEDLLRRAHGVEDDDSDGGDEFYDEEEVVEEDRKQSNLAMFENMMGKYEEEVL